MNNKAFTIMELLIVLGVLSLMAGFVLVTFPAGGRKARDTQRRSDLKQYQTALEVYADKHSGLYPGSVPSSNLVDVCSSLTISACPDDPVAGSNYKYEATTTDYYLWAQLENTDESGATGYFVVCSNGLTDETTTSPAGANCPI